MRNLPQSHSYDDIIDLPHHVSKTRPHMSNYDRAAQFSPFAALTGYDAAIRETERLTDDKIELDEDEKMVLDAKMQILLEHLQEKPLITVTYFCPDEQKSGGTYITVEGLVKRIDCQQRVLVMEDGIQIAVEQIVDITGELVDMNDWTQE